MSSQAPKTAQDLQAQRAQLALLEQDCARLVNPDYLRPFTSLEDAVDRLLPYHVFMDQSSAAEDLREAEAGGGALAASRKDAWLGQCLMHSIEFHSNVFKLHQALDKAEASLLSKSELPHLMLQSYATAEEQELLRLANERKAAAEQAVLAAQQARVLKAQQAQLEAQQMQLEAQRAQQAQLDAALQAQAAAAGGGGQQGQGGAAGAAPPQDGSFPGGSAAQPVQLPPAAPALPGPIYDPAAAAPTQQQPAPQPPPQQERPPQPPRPKPAAPLVRPLTEAEKQAEKQKKLQMMAQRIKQRR